MRSKVVLPFSIVFVSLALGAYQFFTKSYDSHETPSYKVLVTKGIALGERFWAKYNIRDDGLLEVNKAGRHPLWDLTEDAEMRWHEMNARWAKCHKRVLSGLNALKTKQDTL